jgi:hypothetical protein
MKAFRREVQLHSFLISLVDGCEKSALLPGLRSMGKNFGNN